MSKRSWWIAGAVLAGIGLLAFIYQWRLPDPADVARRLEPLRALVKSFGVWAPLVFIVVFVVRPVVLLSSALVAMLGGLLFGWLNGAAYVLIGAMVSGILEFWCVRRFAGDKIRQRVRERAPGIVNVTEKHGFLTIFLVRLIPNVAFDLQNCALALTPARFVPYFWGTFFGCLPAILFYTFLGDQAGSFMAAVH
ncbi:MAG: VTT domain-containing protein [Candidatus Omnitrophica bacterium]|nr:VTT domain-containing protein [Candidatus Omnitrophota bacterium]